MIPKFNSSNEEYAIIAKIASRAHKLSIGKILDTTMDITATHSNGCPLDLEALFNADDFNFMHDVTGIARHLDRKTGRLKDHFSPRFSSPLPASAR